MIENWIVPCNTKYFNVVDHFRKTETVIWKNSFTIKKGDNVYLYLSSPYGEIKFRCTVISDSVADEILSENQYAIVKNPSNNYFSKKIKYIQLQKVVEYPDDVLKIEKLREFGLGQVQIQARADRRLKAFIDDTEKRIMGGGMQNG